MLKNLLIFFVLLSASSGLIAESPTLSRLSHWSLTNDDDSYAVSIWKRNEDLLLGYSFVYENGKRVNATVEVDEFILITQIDEHCYRSKATDFITLPHRFVDVIFCENEDKLFWMTLSEEPISYLPNHMILEKWIFAD